jgi:hypothetical protein
MPTRQMDFVRSSFVVLTCPMGLGPCVGCSTYVLIQPHLSIFNNHSRDVAYQPLVRCVGFAVNTHSVADSLQRRFDCLARPSANPNLFSDNPIRRSDNPALFSDNPIRRSDNPALFSDNPIRRSDNPALFSDNPIRRSDNPALFSAIPIR